MFTRSVPKMSKAGLFRSVLALGVVALIMQLSLPRAQAYDLSSLNGRYADSFSGFHPVSPRPPGVLLPISGFATVYEVIRSMAQAASRRVLPSTSVAATYSMRIGV